MRKSCDENLRSPIPAHGGQHRGQYFETFGLRWLCVSSKCRVSFFPELSLTGYEPRLAKSLATDETDPRLDVFQRCSDAYNIIIGVGLPVSAGDEVQIGMVWFVPNEPRRDYAKQQLHTDEVPFFVPGDKQLFLEMAEHTLAPAICYESLQPGHAEAVSKKGANIYLASVAKPAAGMAKAVLHYPAIARKYNLHVIMANCVGPSYNLVSVGRSAVWNSRGELLAQMDSNSEGTILLDTAIGQAKIRLAPTGKTSGYQQIALEFTKSLAARKYPKAYAMTSQEYRKQTTTTQLRTAFEAIVPTDWGPIDPAQVGQTMTNWPGKRPEDLGWVYVNIGGDVCSEAITVVVTSDSGEVRIREVEFGRP